MITKTLTGVSLVDERYGGVYRKRAMLVCGRSGAGKTVFSLQFLQQGLRQGERCLMLSACPAADLVIYAEAMEIPVEEAINMGSLILLEYQNYVPGRDREEDMTLPPEGFVQIKQIIDTNTVQRVVLDTALPWVSIRSQAKLAEHVFSFVRAFDRLNTTTLLTIPKPVSPIAYRLKNAIEEVVPVSIMMNSDPGSGRRLFNVTKYLGEKKLFPEIEYAIVPKMGIVKVEPAKLLTTAPPAAKAFSNADLAPDTRVKPSFGSFITPAVSGDHTSNAAGAIAGSMPGKVRFSAVIRQPNADK